MNSEQINQYVKSCVSDRPLTDCKHTNFIATSYKATWQFPTHGNVITGTSGMAVAFVHDDEMLDGKLQGVIKNVVEFNGDDIIYHPVSELEKVEPG